MEAQRMSARARAGVARLAVCLAALAALPAAAQNFLWEVSSLTNRAYLFGTVHAGKLEWYPLPPAVREAFEASQALVVEADIGDEQAMNASGAAMTYPPSDSLERHVPAADYARFTALLPRYGLGLAAMSRMKPFMAASLLVFEEWARAGFLPAYGVDGYLLAKAKAEGKPVEELEGVATQMRLMDSLTDAQSTAIFEGTLTAVEDGLAREQIRAVVDAWRSGDTDGLLDAVRRYDARVKGAQAIEDQFVWSRHDAMVAKIAHGLDDTRQRRFIAVGALHLAGPRGLVARLRGRGYMVRRVFVAPPEEREAK